MPLTDFAIHNAKLGSKPLKPSDGEDLHLLVTPAGGKLWCFHYRYLGKQKAASLGAYPEVTLAMARERSSRHSRYAMGWRCGAGEF